MGWGDLKRFTTKLSFEDQRFIEQIEGEIRFGGSRFEDQVKYTALLLKIRRTYRKERLKEPIVNFLKDLRQRNTGVGVDRPVTLTGWELDRFWTRKREGRHQTGVAKSSYGSLQPPMFQPPDNDVDGFRRLTFFQKVKRTLFGGTNKFFLFSGWTGGARADIEVTEEALKLTKHLTSVNEFSTFDPEPLVPVFRRYAVSIQDIHSDEVFQILEDSSRADGEFTFEQRFDYKTEPLLGFVDEPGLSPSQDPITGTINSCLKDAASRTGENPGSRSPNGMGLRMSWRSFGGFSAERIDRLFSRAEDYQIYRYYSDRSKLGFDDQSGVKAAIETNTGVFTRQYLKRGAKVLGGYSFEQSRRRSRRRVLDHTPTWWETATNYYDYFFGTGAVTKPLSVWWGVFKWKNVKHLPASVRSKLRRKAIKSLARQFIGFRQFFINVTQWTPKFPHLHVSVERFGIFGRVWNWAQTPAIDVLNSIVFICNPFRGFPEPAWMRSYDIYSSTGLDVTRSRMSSVRSKLHYISTADDVMSTFSGRSFFEDYFRSFFSNMSFFESRWDSFCDWLIICIVNTTDSWVDRFGAWIDTYMWLYELPGHFNLVGSGWYVVSIGFLIFHLVKTHFTQKYDDVIESFFRQCFGAHMFTLTESTLFVNFILALWSFKILTNEWSILGLRSFNGELTAMVDRNFAGYMFFDKYFFVDGLSFLFVFLTILIIPLCILVSSGIRFKLDLLLRCLIAIEGLLILAFSTSNLFIFYLSFEAVLIPMYFIIGLWGSRSERTRASYLFFIYTLAGSIFFLLALALINIYVGSFDFWTMFEVLPTAPWSVRVLLWICLFCGFAFKVPLYPVHSWLTVAHVEAPTCGSIILASLMLKLGGYGLCRFVIALLPDVTLFFQSEVMAICLVGFIYATASAYRQLDLKRFVAYTSIAHMHFIVLSLFTLTDVGYWGSVHSMISHGFISSGLFLMVGSLYDRFGVRNTSYYAGLADQMPLFAVFWTIFLFANAGIPFFSGFPGEFCGFISTFTMNPVFGFLLAFGFTLGVIYSVLNISRVIHGSPTFWLARRSAVDLLDYEFGALLFLGIWVFTLGIWPELVVSLLRSTCLF